MELTGFSFRDEKVVELVVDLLPPDVLPGQVELPAHVVGVPLQARRTNDPGGLLQGRGRLLSLKFN